MVFYIQTRIMLLSRNNIFVLPLLLFILSLVRADSESSSSSIVVHTDNGDVRGNTEVTLLHYRKFYAFRGIPYAQPPIGELRFKVIWTIVINKNITHYI